MRGNVVHKGAVKGREALVVIRLALASLLPCYLCVSFPYCWYLGSCLCLVEFEVRTWQQNHREQRGISMAYVEKEILNLLMLHWFIYWCSFVSISFHKSLFEAVTRVQWGREIPIVVQPAELSRSLQNKQILIEHNPDFPPRSSLTRKKCSHSSSSRPSGVGGGTHMITSNIKQTALPVYLVKQNALPGYLVLQNMTWISWHSWCLSVTLFLMRIGRKKTGPWGERREEGKEKVLETKRGDEISLKKKCSYS